MLGVESNKEGNMEKEKGRVVWRGSLELDVLHMHVYTSGEREKNGRGEGWREGGRPWTGRRFSPRAAAAWCQARCQPGRPVGSG